MKALLLSLVLLAALATEAQPTGPEEGYVEVFDDADSQLSIYPSDTEETAGLTGQNVIFSDFCIRTRDLVMGDIKRSTTSLATSVFSIFYNSFQRLGLNKLTGLLYRSNEKRPAEQSSGFFGTVVGVLAGAKDAVASSVVNTLYTIKSSVGVGGVSMALQDACAKVNQFEFDMRSRFDQVKAEFQRIAGQATGASVDQLGCITSDRVLLINRFCRMVKVAHEPLSMVMSFVN